MRLRDWIVAAAVTVMLLGGYIATSPVVGRPIHLYAAVVVAVAAAWAVMRRLEVPGVVPVIALCVSFAPGFVTAPAGEYGEGKVVELAATLLAVVAGLYLLRGEARHRAWLWSLALLSILTTVLAHYFPLNSWRLALAGTNYIGSGRLIALGFCVAGMALVLRRGRRWVMLAATLGLGYATFLTGSRGPLLAALCAIVLVAMFRRGVRPSRLVLTVGGLALLAGALWVLAPSDTYAVDRILSFDLGEMSSQSRLAMFALAFRLGLTNPGGIGWGNFGAHPDANAAYPHNILLEVFAEAGWFAGVALLVFMVAALRRLWRHSDQPTAAMLLGVAVYFVLNALVSSDINDNRAMFTALAVAWTLGERPRQQPQRTRLTTSVPVESR